MGCIFEIKNGKFNSEKLSSLTASKSFQLHSTKAVLPHLHLKKKHTQI